MHSLTKHSNTCVCDSDEQGVRVGVGGHERCEPGAGGGTRAREPGTPKGDGQDSQDLRTGEEGTGQGREGE